MADKPFRLRVLEALTAELQGIVRVASDETGPYAWSLAPDADYPLGKVFRGRGTFGRNDPLPMLAILEDPKQLAEDEAAPPRSTAAGFDWDLILQGFVADDPDHPTDPAYYLLADVKAKLYGLREASRYELLGFGPKAPCVMDIQVGSGVIRPPDDISEKTYFFLPVRLRLMEDGANAFT